MDFISQLFDGAGTLLPEVVDLIITLFTKVIGVFYTAPTTSGGTGSLTPVGWLTLVGACFGLFYFGFRWIRGLVRFK